MSRISVVIPAHNAAATISNVLTSLAPDASLIGEIHLIDDRSDDATADRARATAGELGLPLSVHSISAGSAAAARNAGIDRATCPLIYFIDADDMLLPGGLSKLVAAIDANETAGLAIGSSVRRTAGVRDLTRVPSGYGDDRYANAERYLLNQAPPISMGSGLVRASELGGIRFPASIELDEDTWFWAALLASTDVAAIDDVILSYQLDPQRTARRYLRRPRRSWLNVVLTFRRLHSYGVSCRTLAWRRAWLAQRYARQLIKHGRNDEAAAMLRPVLAHRALRGEWRTTRYRLLSGFGRRLRKGRKPAGHRVGDGALRTMVLSIDPAWPPVSGADLRNWQNATAAAELGPVHLVSLKPHGDAPVAVPGFSLASLVRASDPRAASMNWPRSHIEPRIPRFVLQRLLAEIDRFRPDTVIVEGVGLQALMEPIRARVPQLVLDMHNVESELARQMRIGGFKEWLLARREARALKRSDRVWTCTRADRDRLLVRYGLRVPVDVIPNGIPRFSEITCRLGTALRAADQPVVLFVGHLGYKPNVDAAERLAHRIYPQIQSAFPVARLVLAGRSPRSAVRDLADLDGVELHENPDSLAAILEQASLTLIPLRTGGGSRIKILEAAAWGVPVVATPLAAEGLELLADRHILLAETDDELAQQAVDLLGDEGKRSGLRERAYHAVQQLYGPDEIKRAVRCGLGLDA